MERLNPEQLSFEPEVPVGPGWSNGFVTLKDPVEHGWQLNNVIDINTKQPIVERDPNQLPLFREIGSSAVGEVIYIPESVIMFPVAPLPIEPEDIVA